MLLHSFAGEVSASSPTEGSGVMRTAGVPPALLMSGRDARGPEDS